METHQQHKTTFVIIPAFNEKAVIRRVVEEILPLGYNIIVIDDGSAEDIYSEINDLGAVHYVRHKANLGQGAALQTGIDMALSYGGDYFVTFDADGQHSSTEIPMLIQPLINNEADIVLASRFLAEASHNASFLRTLLLHAARWVNFLFTGLYLSDAHNGFRAMNKIAALSIRITENRMAHATEIIAQVKKHRLRYKEIPSTVVYTDYSRRKGQRGIQGIRIFFDLVLQKLFK